MAQITVGVSGGVDSAVAAHLLKEAGHSVTAVFMKNWDEPGCPAEQDYIDARSVCLKLGIPFYSVGFEKEYWDRVFENFLYEYKMGRTPNPDVLCNKEIKFAAFWDYAHSCLGAEKIATGHYARIAFDGERHSLLKGVDERKDQSYFLSFLSEKQLAKAIFPLGEMQKSEVRQIAGKLGLSVAGKKDSTGICFIGERNFREFLSRYLPAQKGDIIDADSGEKIGEHNGLMYYTIGQRKGLGIGNRGGGERWYVVSKELESNVLFAAEGEANPRLFSSGFTSGEVHFVNPMRPQIVRCTVKHRYMQAETPASVRIQPNHVSVAFDAPQAGVAPGQVGAFYMNETCLGGAIIGKSIELAQN